MCSFCLVRAFQAVKWQGAGRVKPPHAFLTRLTLFMAAGLCLCAAATVRLVATSKPPNSMVDPAAPARSAAPRDPSTPSLAQKPPIAPALPLMEAAPPIEPGLLETPRVVALTGAKEHDPKALLAEAERLVAAGVDITILRAAMPPSAASDVGGTARNAARIKPVENARGVVVGVRLSGFPVDSFPIIAGIANGDVITSINGFSISSPEPAYIAYEASKRAGMAVAEVLRGRKRLIVAVVWPEPKRG